MHFCFGFCNKELLLYLLEFGCGFSSYTQSYKCSLIILDSKMLTKTLLISQSFNGVAEVPMSVGFWIF